MLAIGALVSLFAVIFSAICDPLVWPSASPPHGHVLFLFAVMGSLKTLATPVKLFAAALFCEVFLLLALPLCLFSSCHVERLTMERFMDGS